MIKYDLELYLNRLKEQIIEIEEFTEGFDSDSFGANRMLILACARNLQILVSCIPKIKALSPELLELNPDVDWDGIGNIWHCTGNPDYDSVWGIIQNELPKIKHDLENLKFPPIPKGRFRIVKTIEFNGEDYEDYDEETEDSFQS